MLVEEAQTHLRKLGLSGWLLYDFQGSNALARQILGNENRHLTRRFFYWIPAKGEPVKIVHAIEQDALEPLPGRKETYLSWESLESLLRLILQGTERVAMEFVPRCGIPAISKVDAGTVQLVESCGPTVVSSAPFLAYFTAVWSEEQWQSHQEAARAIDRVIEAAWKHVGEKIGKITEYELQQWVLAQIEQEGMMTDWAPICAVNAHAANPHYSPAKDSALIKQGDFILLDLGCKKKDPNAVYVDVTHMAVAAPQATARQKEIFSIVKEARDQAIAFIRARLAAGQEIKGYEVDQVCRGVIAQAGYGPYFVHRTGHNIHTTTHGPGTHLDSLETWDDRPLIPRTCFSVEPGIYLPGELGVRLECDVYITEKREALVTSRLQEEIYQIRS